MGPSESGSEGVEVDSEVPSSSWSNIPRDTPIPLSEISANVVRIPHSTVVESHETAKSELDSDHPQNWKTLLSPVAEEPPSPRKRNPRKTRACDENLLLGYSPRSRLVSKSPETLLLGYSTMPEDASKSPRKAPSRPLSPGSLKMQNFLKRLERQGLSHD